MAHTTWQEAADDFWREVRGTVRENGRSAVEAEECVARYRETLRGLGVSEGLVYHHGVEAAATAAMQVHGALFR